MDQITSSIVTIAVALIGVATLAVLVSKNANTSGVISSAGNAFSQSLMAATGPVTGNASIGGGFSGTLPTYGFGQGYQIS